MASSSRGSTDRLVPVPAVLTRPQEPRDSSMARSLETSMSAPRASLLTSLRVRWSRQEKTPRS